MSDNPLLGLTRDGDQGFEIIETERSPVAPLPGLILERTLLVDILPDRRLDVATSQPVRGFAVFSFVEMKLALSQDEESQCTFHGGGRRRRAGEDQAAGVTVLLARTVRLAGDSRSD